MTRLTIMGPPGAGKGTQAQHVAARLNIPAISTGSIFRKHMREGTDLGILAAGFIEEGEFVPDEVTNSMVRGRLEKDDCAQGFLLDGYPRSVAQAQYLDSILEVLGQGALDGVLCLELGIEESVQRILARALTQDRKDDTEPVIRHRMDVYHEQTEPLLSYYRNAGLLIEIDGSGSIEDVQQRIDLVLQRFV
ncbi:MAG: adenylate kinase [Actinomycetaceae bacterium]|nr:adenylate kinase [Actinomycetaceae bacterium]